MAVLAASSPSTAERIERARRHLEEAGLSVEFASNLFARDRSYLAGSDEVRARELNELLRRDDFDAFLFARGGYGAMRILDAIDYQAIATNPRPLIGYSDVTAIHQAVAARAGVASFHGPMLNTDFFERLSPARDTWFWSMLGGEAPLSLDLLDEQILSPGRASGILFGGCLSLTAALVATPYDFWVDDGIWFWEETDEPTYRIDRMLTHLKLSGRLQSIRGVMIGKLKKCGESDAGELNAVLSELFVNRGIPVVRDLPFGHHGDNLLLPIGRRVTLDADARLFTIEEPAVEPATTRRR
ncbi:MAG TPA: LD-carboxypeptidase [Thermoanaerobaculia bacterium]|nr:LD-carboxypeptidase [Thermoanaerobaculia bacterium]